MEKEKGTHLDYLTYWDIKIILSYMEEIREYCFQEKIKEAYKDIEELYENHGVILELIPDTCNVFLRGKF